MKTPKHLLPLLALLVALFVGCMHTVPWNPDTVTVDVPDGNSTAPVTVKLAWNDNNTNLISGVRFMKVQQWKSAISELEQPAAKTFSTHLALGVCYEMTGDLDKALASYIAANQNLRGGENLQLTGAVDRVRNKLGKKPE